MTPVRVRLSRKKGWRMPANTVKVDRSTRWGNPFPVPKVRKELRRKAQAATVEIFRCVLNFNEAFPFNRYGSLPTNADIREHLRGKNLACWCALGSPCHADVLLMIANAP